MIPYSSGIIFDSSNHYRILKTETLFGFARNRDNFVHNGTTKPLEWIFTNDNLDRGTPQDMKSSRSLKSSMKTTVLRPQTRSNKETKAIGKKHGKKSKKKFKKCILKLLKHGKKSKRKGKMYKKYMMPLILGLMAAKSLLVLIALKALAFVSAKGLMMGFFSTMLASVLSLKGMFEHSHGWNRKDDAKTQVEIIQVPSKSDEHYYYDDHYKRGDYIPYQKVK